MSLLLDALKKAAQEKLEKQARETGVTPEHAPEQPAPSSRADSAGAPGDEMELNIDLTDLDEEPARMNTGQRSGVLANELEFFLDDATTGRHRGDEHETGELSLETADSGDPYTGDFQGYDAAGVFASKSPVGQRRLSRTVPAVLGIAALVAFGGWFAYRTLSGPDSTGGPSVPAAASDSTPAPATQPPEEPALEIAEEDYSALLGEAVTDDFESDMQPVAPSPEGGVDADTAPPGEQVSRVETRPPETTVPRRPRRLSIEPSSPQGEPIYQVLLRGYDAYRRGDLGTAEIAYQRALGRAPRNRDALLGLAAVHQLRGDYATARRYYEKLLELDPRDDAALAGLTALEQTGGGAAPDAQFSQLKKLLAEKPDSPHLHFTLGNLYAAHRRWPEAQQAYFQAYRLADDNADYAFNLAVSLDHLGQRPVALKFYRRALALTEERPARFDPAAALRRIRTLQGGEAG